MLPPLLMLLGCGVDLPEGWEDAEPVDKLIQTDCNGGDTGGGSSAYDTGIEPTIDPQGGEDELFVVYTNAHFRCSQDVAGFVRRSDGVDLLVQPEDMNPSSVAACDCLYDVYLQVLDIEPCRDCTVSLYRRWDNLNDENDPELVGQAQVTIRD